VSGANALVVAVREVEHTCSPVDADREDEGQELRIGELARRAGVSVRSLRYYEQQGLLGSERTAGGQRVYAPSAVERVHFIQQLYAAGVPSRVIVDLLPCFATGVATTSMLALMEHERDAIAERLRELTAAHERLDRVIDDVRRAGVVSDDGSRASA
jgi:DNA-binding transcriptional MerR regulator